MNPLVSIIVPCFNQAIFLPEALQSVLEQTNKQWECIIVNDGSPDDTEKVAQEWLSKDIRFKYIYKENGGLSSARNAGIKTALGKYILPLDADDMISNNYLEVCLLEFKNNPHSKLVYGSAIKFGAVNYPWNLSKFKYEALLQNNMIYCSALFKKDDWSLIGGYDEEMKFGFEDWEFWIRLLNHNATVLKCEAAVFFYRTKKNSMITILRANGDLTKEIRKYIFDKHRDKYTLLTDYEQFEQNRVLVKSLNNLHISQTYNSLIKALLKKVYIRIFKFKI
ncbi:glycosyltransferase family 2 protein [Flavobacterium sp.]|uniref:glycosyltransferase family 2 protein n=1 Tax=Flavobacterium sp. TaxID=239 RepID=UPI0037BEC01C